MIIVTRIVLVLYLKHTLSKAFILYKRYINKRKLFFWLNVYIRFMLIKFTFNFRAHITVSKERPIVEK